MRPLFAGKQQWRYMHEINFRGGYFATLTTSLGSPQSPTQHDNERNLRLWNGGKVVWCQEPPGTTPSLTFQHISTYFNSCIENIIATTVAWKPGIKQIESSSCWSDWKRRAWMDHNFGLPDVPEGLSGLSTITKNGKSKGIWERPCISGLDTLSGSYKNIIGSKRRSARYNRRHLYASKPIHTTSCRQGG